MKVSYMFIEFVRKDNNELVRRIPYKMFYTDYTVQETKEEKEKNGNKKHQCKIVVWDTKKFKMKGQRIFITDLDKKTDAWECMAHIDYQGFQEGWYDPRLMRSYVTPTNKETFYEKYEKYNRR